MAASNMEGLKRAISPHALHKLKTCESHFKECRNRQVRKWNDHERRNFKDMRSLQLSQGKLNKLC